MPNILLWKSFGSSIGLSRLCRDSRSSRELSQACMSEAGVDVLLADIGYLPQRRGVKIGRTAGLAWPCTPNGRSSLRSIADFHLFRSRIATELGLQEPFKPSDFIRYRSLTPVSDELYPYFCENRIRSWTLLFCADLAVSVHTGRLSASNGLMFTSGTWHCTLSPPFPLLTRASTVAGALNRVPPPPPTDPYYSFRANEALNRVLVKAIVFVSTLEQDTSGRTDLRETFLSTWRDDLIRWASDWTAVCEFVRFIPYLKQS